MIKYNNNNKFDDVCKKCRAKNGILACILGYCYKPKDQQL